MRLDLEINKHYGFDVRDEKFIRLDTDFENIEYTPMAEHHVMDENIMYEDVILHRIMERSAANKLILVSVSEYKGVPRSTLWIKYGSPLAQSLDKKRKMRLW